MQPKRGPTMPELKVAIGGHEFRVHCQPGEEPTLLAAAKLLDAEAATVIARNGRMPDVRLLLLAGLLLADRTAAAEDQLRAVRARAEAVEKRLADQGRK